MKSTVNVLAVQLANKLYRELGVREITERLLICDESEVLWIFETESHSKRHTIGDAVRLLGITRTSYRYIPLLESEMLNCEWQEPYEPRGSRTDP